MSRTPDEIAATGTAWITETELASLIEQVRELRELVEKTIYKPPGYSGPDVWWADEARALLARGGTTE